VHARHACAFYAVVEAARVAGVIDRDAAHEYTSGAACIAGFRVNLGDHKIQDMLSQANVPFHRVGRIAGDAIFFDNSTFHWVVNHETCVKVIALLNCIAF
jgi:hypothetical protein